MEIIPVASPSDPRIAVYRDLREADLLRRHGVFVAEGRLVVARVLADRRYEVQSLLVNAASLDALEPQLRSRGFDGPVYRSSSADFEAITGFNLHRGCLAVVSRPPICSWQEAVAASRLVIALEGVTNADNVGSVFRNAAAFGAGAVLLSPTSCDPLYRKAVRTSMGAVLQVPFARLEPWPAALDELRSVGFTVAALSPREPAIALDLFAATVRGGRVVLLLGAEGPGLTPEAERYADVRVRIPISADVDSLNLSVAAGIALHRVSEGMSLSTDARAGAESATPPR